ncbi:sacsin N-terminal ATP-binding-like domain-containing protein [Promicromonospora sp. CA-289599]|uniref:sacsin N-terminal ATP-binding-like domain-containing protein n=1 Tax=Promicromonospora sp. CA-289599 TaxID=3240014 RepID=UPI003D905CF2
MTRDPFGTGALRRAVTEAWRASPTRFREDANSEEDHARGYYRDRVVVELAQNAADAAARAGVPGRLTFRLEADVSGAGGPGDGGAGWRLVAANTGTPLDAAGVASLASLRASAKVPADAGEGSGQAMRAVGRFGVGFAAVRSVSDEVVVRSRTGGVRFSLAGTRAELGLEVGPSLDTHDEVGSSHRDRSSAGPISIQTADLAPDVEQGADLAPKVARMAAIRDEARSRGAALPALRLPFPAPGTTPDEPDTVVELVLRDADAVAAVRAQLAALDDALLLALPALDEVVIEDDFAGQPGSEPHSATPLPSRRVLRDVGSRWRVHRASGALGPDDSLPSEARRPDWSVLWALPAGGGRAAESAALHAPTPTDVRLTFPALLIASFPVDPGRRGVLPGPTSDRVAAEAGRAYAAFLGELGAEREVLGLVPTGLPAGDVDAAIRASADVALRDTPLLRLSAPAQGRTEAAGADGTPDTPLRVAPRGAAFLAGPLGEDPALASALAAGTSAALVTVPVRYQTLARSLGAESVGLADLVETLPPEPGVIRAALDAIAPHAGEPPVLEAVAGAPLPLADGRVTRGARGTVLLDAPHLAGIARALGVRVVHPDVAHPLLERAGAASTTPQGLLADPAVRSTALAAAEDVLDDGDAEHLGAVLAAASPAGASDTGSDPGGWDPSALDDPTSAEVVVAVLELVRLAAETGSADLPFWLGELPVVADGDVVPLRETALPGTWAAEHMDLALVRDDVVERWGRAALAAAGARAELVVYRVADVVTADGDDTDYGPDDPAGWLSDWDEYLQHLADELGPGAWIGDVEAVSDLDALRDPTDAGPGPLAAALGRVSGDPGLRRALLTPVRSPDAPGRQAVSYTAWFLRRRVGAPFALGDTPLLPLAPPATTGLDDDVLAALGGLHNLADLPGHDWPAVLERLPDSQAGGRRTVSADVARAVWAGLAALARADDPRPVAPPRLPALGPAGVTVESADDLAVAASARWAQLGPVVPAPVDVAEALAELLDLPFEGDTDVVPDEPGEAVELDPRVRALAPDAPSTWRRHDVLTVEGKHVAWWVTESAGRSDEGVAHAISPEGLARALAELTSVDPLLLEAALRDPARAEELSAERVWE